MSNPLDREGLFEQSASSIRTVSDGRVDVLNINPVDVNIDDIGHALSRQCRYNGHCDGFLSVARHSLWVSARLKSEGPLLEMWGLLHDATEAYLGDMVKPLKRDPSMIAFVEAEARAEKVIAEVFELPYPMPAVVHEADRFVTVEVEIGMGLRDWNGSSPNMDEDEFLARFVELGEELDELEEMGLL